MAVVEQPDVITWIRGSANKAKKVLSGCTGGLLLFKAKLLGGLKATKNRRAFEILTELAPNTKIIRNERFIDSRTLIASGGISAGIYMSLYVIGLLYGEDTS